VASLLVVPEDGRPIVHDVGELVRRSGLEVDEIVVEQGRLDDVFRDLTSGAH
jgi:ABC-2 type transport system ATP-binding protein